MEITRAITWDDTKHKGLTQAITWDDTKRRKVVGAFMTLSVGALLLQAPLAPPPAYASSSAPVSVIVQTAGDSTAAVSAINAAGGHVVSELGFINSVAARVPASALGLLKASPAVLSVTPNSQLDAKGATYSEAADPDSLLNTEAAVGASAMYAQGITGRGVGVALIDTGVAPVAGLDGRGKLVTGADLSFDRLQGAPAGIDAYGHGTHLAGIIAGHDAGADPANPLPGQFLGIAPDAQIVNVKVGDARGQVDVSQVIAAIGWVIQHRNENNIRVLNISYGSDSRQDYRIDPLARAAEAAWRAGIVVVAAAGNNGTGVAHLSNPASDPLILAVGAMDLQTGAITSFSSRGHGTRNADLIAPGAHIPSLRVPGSYIDTTVSTGKDAGARFQRGSGTSQATAVVSGAAALLLQQHPNLTPDDVKAGLMAAAAPAHGKAAGVGIHVDTVGALLGTLGDTTQHLAASTGTGSLEAARGSQHVITPGGQTLAGEKTFDGASWKGGTWTGGTWTGGTWTGGTWTGGTWTGGTWTGGTWTGGTWTGGTWTGGTWTGGTWTGGTWTGGTWTGGTWTGGTWTGGSWD